MFILGLTGSIAMGKSTAAADFRRLGVPVHDADATVHLLMGSGGEAVPLIDAAFPGVVVDGRVDRQALGGRVFGDDAALKRLEAILHPRVRAAEWKFLADQARRGTSVVVLDIPLLFETGGVERCDAVAVVSAPAFLQERRVLARPGMTCEKFRSILGRQTADEEKRRRADFVILTGQGRAFSLKRIRRLLALCRIRPGHVWKP